MAFAGTDSRPSPNERTNENVRCSMFVSSIDRHRGERERERKRERERERVSAAGSLAGSLTVTHSQSQSPTVTHSPTVTDGQPNSLKTHSKRLWTLEPFESQPTAHSPQPTAPLSGSQSVSHSLTQPASHLNPSILSTRHDQDPFNPSMLSTLRDQSLVQPLDVVRPLPSRNFCNFPIFATFQN